MSTFKIKYFQKTKKIDNTIWLDRLINQLEKQAKKVWLWILLEINNSKINWIPSMPSMIAFEAANYWVPLKNYLNNV